MKNIAYFLFLLVLCCLSIGCVDNNIRTEKQQKKVAKTTHTSKKYARLSVYSQIDGSLITTSSLDKRRDDITSSFCHSFDGEVEMNHKGEVVGCFVVLGKFDKR